MLARAFLLSALLLARIAPAQSIPAALPSATDSEFTRELRMREAAANPALAAAWFEQALRAPAESLPWTATADALDALGRAIEARPELDLEPWRADVQRWSTSAHPNQRALAWRVLAAAQTEQAPRFAYVPAAGLTTWEERRERACFVARSAADEAALESLCADPDERVAETALREWAQSPARSDERFCGAWLRALDAARGRADGSALDLLLLLELAPDAGAVASRVCADFARKAGEEPQVLQALGLALLCRQGVPLAPAQLDFLAGHWDRAARWHPRARALLARAARCLGESIGLRLVEAGLLRRDSPEAALADFAGAVEAMEPNRMLRAAQALAHGDPALAEALWDSLRGRVEAWEPAALAVWLSADVAAEQRGRCLLVVAETFRQNGDPGSAAILLGALDDRDPAVAAEAFQGLAAAPDPRPWMEALQRCWAQRPAGWRIKRLGDLSREQAWTPFRADLLELASSSRASSATVAELLAAFRGDSDVIDALRAWFEQDLAALSERPRGGPESELDPRTLSSALVLARALSLAAGEEALPSLAAGLEISRERSIELGKACILHLGRSAKGRAGLPAWLGPSVHSRLRAEAALALAVAPERGAALRVLLEDYERYDEDLRSRALRAFALGDDPQSAQRLLSVARARECGPAELLTALECIGERSRRAPELSEALFAWLEEEGLNPELRTLCLEVLARHGDARIHARLSQRLRSLEPSSTQAQAGSRAADERALERETLISALAAADAVAEVEARTAFALPLESAAEEFHARCVGRRRAEVEFTWRSELALLAAFARAGRIESVLEGVEGWRGLDARLLLEAAARVEAKAQTVPLGQPDASERLALAAIVALAGEVSIEDSARVRFEARRRSLDAAAQRDDHAAFAARAAGILRDVRSGAVPDWVFARSFGDFDPARGVDGLARLCAQWHAARARVALAAGHLDEVQREREAARAACGASRAASEACDRLDREF